MALETITQQQQQYLCALLGSTNWSVGSDSGSGSGSGSALDYYNNEGFDEFLTNNQNVSAPQEYDDYSNWNLPPPLLVDSQNEFHEWDQTFSVLDHNFTIPDQQEQLPALGTPVENCSSTTRPRRRRTRTKKNEEEIENQRITHIAVERNRRKQMNEYLSVLRTLMPQSYVQRGDQASIVSAAINYVKELEQQLQFLSGQKHLTGQNEEANGETSPFSEFFSIPQYSTTMTVATTSENGPCMNENYKNQQLPATADIEVTMVENHANLKIRSKRRPRLLPRIISGLESLRLSVLHLNVSKVDQFVLCSLSLKVEEDCQMSSVEEIAAVVNQILRRIHEEAN
ncbi:transcription factor bHLH94-like [Capsicum chacoense]|uniref:Transcription factor bHLH96 n=1 Tax=Capsicum annuum TaxID=4072 RepID=A0A2G2YZK0_CAPAN|nr:transcription factor bHLH94-like [Capsicum annuum]KAF3656958.1 Transcription factor bHLH96 [Capsicum annuum]PHT75071.1 Transcription factor bHLH96 [Capsicum annuum]